MLVRTEKNDQIVGWGRYEHALAARLCSLLSVSHRALDP
jgi:hypothetical protein